MGMEGFGALVGLLEGMSSGFESKSTEGLEEQANAHAANARDAVPTDTGELQASIRVVRDSPRQVVVLAGEDQGEVDYAGHVEYGTSKMEPRPFMRPAAIESESNMEGIMTQAIKRLKGFQ